MFEDAEKRISVCRVLQFL